MLDLSFDVAPYLAQGEPLKLGEQITVPRYGSLTVEEAILLDGFADDIRTESVSNLNLAIGLATVLLQCRFDADWNALLTCKLPLHWIEAAAEFLLKEKDRWQAPKTPQGDDPEKK